MAQMNNQVEHLYQCIQIPHSKNVCTLQNFHMYRSHTVHLFNRLVVFESFKMFSYYKAKHLPNVILEGFA